MAPAGLRKAGQLAGRHH